MNVLSKELKKFIFRKSENELILPSFAKEKLYEIVTIPKTILYMTYAMQYLYTS